MSQAVLNILPEAEINAEEAEGLTEDKIIILSGVVSKKRYTKAFFNLLLESVDLEKLNNKVAIPNVVGKEVYDAINILEGLGLQIEVQGDGGNIVKMQFPSPDTEISINSVVMIDLL